MGLESGPVPLCPGFPATLGESDPGVPSGWVRLGPVRACGWVPSCQDLGKCSECGDMLMEAQEEVKTLRQQAPASAGSVTHYTYCTSGETPAPACYLCVPCVYPQFLPGPGGVCVWGLLLRSSGNVPLSVHRRHFLISRRPWLRAQNVYKEDYLQTLCFLWKGACVPCLPHTHSCLPGQQQPFW